MVFPGRFRSSPGRLENMIRNRALLKLANSVPNVNANDRCRHHACRTGYHPHKGPQTVDLLANVSLFFLLMTRAIVEEDLILLVTGDGSTVGQQS